MPNRAGSERRAIVFPEARRPARAHLFYSTMNALIWLAIVLLVIWVLARVVFAVTGMLLHLLWIAALIFGAIWLFQNVVK